MKFIADGMMRAKKIEDINLSGNNYCAKGISQILYNLAFSPRIRKIDISGIYLGGSEADVAESLGKMLRITGSLEELNISNLNIIAYLKDDFFIALGENKTLKTLRADQAALINNHALFGKACGMNAKKNGSLENLYL